MQLTTNNENALRDYFNGILKLYNNHCEFPVNLDDVWMLVYSNRSHAIRSLKASFIQDVDYQALFKDGERKGGGQNKVTYMLTTQCLEYFVAKKVRSVFEVYQKVFKKTVTEKMEQKPLTQSQLILQQAQFLVDMEQRTLALEQQQSELANKLDTIERNQKQAELELFSLETSDNPVPEVTLRTKVIELVAKYAETRFPTEPNKYQLAWRFFYDELLRRYHFRAYEDPSRGYKKLDDVEQRGAMQKLFDLVSFHIKKLQEDEK